MLKYFNIGLAKLQALCYHQHMNNHSSVHANITGIKLMNQRAGIVRYGIKKETEENKMKKKFKLEDLDCANCAAKMEAAIKEIPGVINASVNFLAQKMMIEADDDKFDDIVKKAAECISKVEPDCKVVL